MRNCTKPIAAALLLSSAMPLPAWAQSATSPEQDVAESSDDASRSNDIVVTARRREEKLSKVPIAVVAISAEQIAAKSIVSETDLQAAVPGLVIKQSVNANAFNYVIRGQTIDSYSNSPPGVLPYINEAQVKTLSGSAFYDMGGIQVLKGPQGTLFGRNATGGAVLFATQQPTDDFGGYLKARYGRFDAYGVEGAINLPLADSVKLRIAGSKIGGGAFSKRLDTDKYYGNFEQRSIRGTLLIEPSSSIKNVTVVQHTRDGGTNAPGVIYHSQYFRCGLGLPATDPISSTSPNVNGQGYTSTTDCAYRGYASDPNRADLARVLTSLGLNPATASTSDITAVQDKLGPWRVVGSNGSLEHSGRSSFVVNTTELELSPSLTAKNILMFNDGNSNERNENDGSPFPVIGVDQVINGVESLGGFYSKTRQFSNELQLQGKALDDRLDFVVGAFYLKQTDTIDSTVSFFGFPPYIAYPATRSTFLPIHYIQTNTDKSVALFAQASFALTDQLHVTGGFRYTWETLGAYQRPGSDWYGCQKTLGPNVCGGIGDAQREKTKSSDPSWNVSVDYQLNPELMVYATTRGSWRAGNFNFTLPPNPVSGDKFGNLFFPETVRDAEVGLKYNGRDLIGVPLSFNVAGYKMWVKNIQRGANVVSLLTGTSILATVNVPNSEIWGVEADASVRPNDWLNLGGSVTYTNAKFTKNVVNLLGNPPLAYGPYADSPKWSGSAFAEVSGELGNELGTLTVRGDFYFQSSNVFSNLGGTLVPGTDIAAYQLANGRVTWDHVMGSNISVAAYGRNLLNEKYYTGGNGTGYSAGLNLATVGTPRTYGVEVKVPF